jgi:hypothetical protein
MYDFLLTEGTNPDEGAQNYLHQSAEPLQNVYDPENDGIYLSDSLGVHEHWDTSEDIFSSKRYSGPINNGIDYITTLQEENFKVDADGPYFGFINNPVKFNGNASGGYPPYNWHWDFGDGYSSEEQNPTHTYTSTGNYIVILTVADYSSNTSSDTTYAWIQVTNDPPNNLVIDGPTSGNVGTSYDYSFKVDDPEGAIVWYYIEWGDNTNSGWLGPFESGEEIVNSHAWSSQGSYTIRAKAKDLYNDEGPWGTFDVTMPRSKIITNSLFFSFLERFTNLFPILQKFFQHY